MLSSTIRFSTMHGLPTAFETTFDHRLDAVLLLFGFVILFIIVSVSSRHESPCGMRGDRIGSPHWGTAVKGFSAGIRTMSLARIPGSTRVAAAIPRDANPKAVMKEVLPGGLQLGPTKSTTPTTQGRSTGSASHGGFPDTGEHRLPQAGPIGFRHAQELNGTDQDAAGDNEGVAGDGRSRCGDGQDRAGDHAGDALPFPRWGGQVSPLRVNSTSTNRLLPVLDVAERVMKSLSAFSLALALAGLAGHGASAQTDRIVGGITSVTFSSSFLAYTRESGIFLTDLGGNALQNGVEPLPAVQGAIDLQTGITDVIFKEGFQFSYLGRTTLRIENLILHATRTSSDITGDVIVNGHLLGRQEVFTVNKNPDLSLPLPVENGILTLPTLSLGLSPEFVTQLDAIIGPLVNAGSEVAQATPVAVVVPDATTFPE